jgi:tRNA 2-thiouridine synthesizing protein A
MNELPYNLIDCIGLKCPMPILKSRLALNPMKPDDIALILSDDTGFISDIRTFCFQAGLELLSATKEPTHHSFKIRVK